MTLDARDLQVDVTRCGASVKVRVLHRPTGAMAEASGSGSQIALQEQAVNELRAKLTTTTRDGRRGAGIE